MLNNTFTSKILTVQQGQVGAKVKTVVVTYIITKPTRTETKRYTKQVPKHQFGQYLYIK